MIDRFERLFAHVISMWPASIRVTDRTIYATGGATIPAVTDIHDGIRQRLLDAGDDDGLMHMDWAMYTVIHKIARVKDEVIVTDINKEEVRAIFERNVGLD